MNIKELREQTKALFKESGAHPYLTVIGLYLIEYAVCFAFQTVFVALSAHMSGRTSALSVILFLILYIALFAVSIWAGLSLSWYYMRISRRETPGESFKMAFHALPGFISYTLIYSIATGIAVIFIPFVIIMALAAMEANAVFIAIFAAVIIIGLIYVGLTFAFNPFCYYDRGKKTIMQTLKRNFEVTKGHKWQILKVMLVYYMPLLIVYAIAIGCFAYLAYAVQNQSESYGPLLGIACVMILAFLGTAIYFIWALPNVFTNLCIMYNDITGYEPEPELAQGEIVAEILEE